MPQELNSLAWDSRWHMEDLSPEGHIKDFRIPEVVEKGIVQTGICPAKAHISRQMPEPRREHMVTSTCGPRSLTGPEKTPVSEWPVIYKPHNCTHSCVIYFLFHKRR